jgi:hypothetical protein
LRLLTQREFDREGDYFNRGLIELSHSVCKLQNENKKDTEFYFLSGSFGISLGHISIICSIVKDHINNTVSEPNFRFNYDFYDKVSRQDSDLRDFYITSLLLIEEKFNGKAFFTQTDLHDAEFRDEKSKKVFGVWNLPVIHKGIISQFSALSAMNRDWDGSFFKIEDFYRIQSLTIPIISSKKELLGVSIRTNHYYPQNVKDGEIRTPNSAKYDLLLRSFENTFDIFEFGVIREPSMRVKLYKSGRRENISLIEQIYFASKCRLLILTHNGMADVLGEFSLPHVLFDDFPTNQIWHHKAVLKQRIRHGNRKIEQVCGNLKYLRDVPKKAEIQDSPLAEMSEILHNMLDRRASTP